MNITELDPINLSEAQIDALLAAAGRPQADYDAAKSTMERERIAIDLAEHEIERRDGAN